MIMETETHRTNHQDGNLDSSWFCYIDPEFSKTAAESFLLYACHIIFVRNILDNIATLSTGSSSVTWLVTDWINLVKSMPCPSPRTHTCLSLWGCASGRPSFDYASSHPGPIVVLVRLFSSISDHSQLWNSITCPLIALLFSTMPSCINCSTN